MSLVPVDQRSAQFERVSRELDLGGTLYGYVDLDGDSQKLARMMQPFLQAPGNLPASAAGTMAALRRNLPAIFSSLGLDDITAIGVSSAPEAGGQFRNRAFFYTPNGRHGLLEALGGPAAPFANLRLAPPDADFYLESEVDLPVLYAAIKRTIDQVSGPAAVDRFERQIGQLGNNAGWSVLEYVHALRGRVTAFGRFEEGKVYRFGRNPGLAVPRLLLVVRVDGIGSLAERSLAKLPAASHTAANGRSYYRLPGAEEIDGLRAEAVVEGEAFYFTTDADFLDHCLAQPAGLESNLDFQKLLAALGPDGNSLTYVTPRFGRRLRSLPELNPSWPSNLRQTMTAALAANPEDPEAIMLVRRNLSDGILVRARYNRSFKRELALPAVYNPVTLAAIFSLSQYQRTLAAQQAALAAAQARAGRAAPAPGAMPRPPGSVPPSGNRPLVPVFQPMPFYPKDLDAAGVPGAAIVEFVVSPQGTVLAAPDTQLTSDPEFSAAAAAALSRWRFNPAVRGGKTVASRLQVPVLFYPAKARVPAAQREKDRRDFGAWYQEIQTEWRSVESDRSLGPASSGSIWARVALDATDHLVVEDVGRGRGDPDAPTLRQLLEDELGDNTPVELLQKILKGSGHLDLALPRYVPPAPAAPAPAKKGPGP